VSIIKKEIPDAIKQKGYLLYPTVFTQEVSLFHYKPVNTLKSIAVYNSIGQMVWHEQYNGNATNNITVNLQGRLAGVYFVRLKYTDRDDIVEKIVKQ
jgi:hypothetical protein